MKLRKWFCWLLAAQLRFALGRKRRVAKRIAERLHRRPVTKRIEVVNSYAAKYSAKEFASLLLCELRKKLEYQIALLAQSHMLSEARINTLNSREIRKLKEKLSAHIVSLRELADRLDKVTSEVQRRAIRHDVYLADRCFHSTICQIARRPDLETELTLLASHPLSLFEAWPGLSARQVRDIATEHQ
jgi:hypothetical protein